jgi:hypothetical protein
LVSSEASPGSVPRHEAQEAPARTGIKRALAQVFLSDWHPVLRDPLDLFRLSFPIGALIYALIGDWDAAVRLAAPGLAVFLVRAIDVPRPIDWIFCAAMFFQGWATHCTCSVASGGTTTPSTSRCR